MLIRVTGGPFDGTEYDFPDDYKKQQDDWLKQKLSGMKPPNPSQEEWMAHWFIHNATAEWLGKTFTLPAPADVGRMTDEIKGGTISAKANLRHSYQLESLDDGVAQFVYLGENSYE